MRFSFQHRRALVCLWLVFICVSRADSQTETSFPNHYIVVIDSSGSARGQQRYGYAVRELLPQRLLQSGFSSIPVFDVKKDLISICHFGIDTGPPDTAYLRLKNMDLSSDLIHCPLTAARAGEREIREALPSRIRYSLTVLAWSLPLAIWRVRPENAERTSRHTFLVTLHDGRYNEGGPIEELKVVHRHGNPENVKQTDAIVTQIRNAYKIVGDKGEELATGEEIHSGGQTLYLETYEVLPRSSEMLHHGDFKMFSGVKVASGSPAEGRQASLYSTISEPMQRWLREQSLSHVTVEGVSSAEESSGRFELPWQASEGCQREVARLTISAWRTVPDTILGSRLVPYSESEEVELPQPFRCALQQPLVIASAAAATTTAGLWIWFRFFATGIMVMAAGVVPIHLRRRQELKLDTLDPGRGGTTALVVRLPGIFVRTFCYAGARLTLLNAFWTHTGVPVTRLRPWSPRVLKARLTGQADGSSCILALQQTGGSSHFQIQFTSRSKPMSEKHTPDIDKIKHFVALDLGSESMAAYHFDSNLNRTRPINLRQFADADALYNEFAPRLRSRILLREYKETDIQSDLQFIKNGSLDRTENGKSVFEFFIAKDRGVFEHALPNLKIAFQRGAHDLIPELSGLSDSKVQYTPEELICWMTTQIVRNLLLEFTGLRNVPRDTIYVILTVPNVYSVTHVEKLKSFVRQHLSSLGGVESVYESDAVAYYPLAPGVGDGTIQNMLEELRASHGKVYVVTFDMGRGTTDLSLCELVDTQEYGLHPIAHAGRSDGGGKLTHLFAQYFDEQIAKTVTEHDRQLQWASLLRDIRTDKQGEHNKLVEKLETYIDALKPCITGEWKIEANASLKESGESLAAAIAVFYAGTDSRVLAKKLEAALELRTLKPGWSKRKYAALKKLRKRLDSYIEENVVQLLKDLKLMAEANGGVDGNAPLAFDEGNVIAIIAGQAAQFGPVKAKLTDSLNKQFSAKGTRVISLSGADAKLCCAQGAVQLFRRGMQLGNSDLITGTYGLQPPLGKPLWFTFTAQEPFNVDDVPPDAKYELVFAPKPKSVLENENNLDPVTRITMVSAPQSRLRVEYDPNQRVLLVNGKAVALQTYHVPEEDKIYEQVWPEVRPAAAETQRSSAASARSGG